MSSPLISTMSSSGVIQLLTWLHMEIWQFKVFVAMRLVEIQGFTDHKAFHCRTTLWQRTLLSTIIQLFLDSVLRTVHLSPERRAGGVSSSGCCRPVTPSSYLLCLSPELDVTHKIMSVGGWLHRVEGLDPLTVHCIVLDPYHHTAKLLIQDYDTKPCHPVPE